MTGQFQGVGVGVADAVAVMSGSACATKGGFHPKRRTQLSRMTYPTAAPTPHQYRLISAFLPQHPRRIRPGPQLHREPTSRLAHLPEIGPVTHGLHSE